MKANLTGKILTVTRGKQGETSITIETAGRVDVKSPQSQSVSLVGTLTLRDVIADNMKIGSCIRITISDENVID